MQPAFPSSVERNVASGLLLLSTTPPSPSPLPSSSVPSSSVFDFDEDESLKVRNGSMNKIYCSRNSLKSSDSVTKSPCSSLTIDDGSSDEIKSRSTNLAEAAVRCREIKLKVVRKSRSKIHWIPDCRKFISGTVSKTSAGSETTDASCLSSSSSALSSTPTLISVARAVGERKRALANEEKRKKRNNGSNYICRRAEAILKLLSQGGSSEVRIRQLLGDSPDTTKALRMLLRLDAVKRSGTGGLQDPYIYMVAE